MTQSDCDAPLITEEELADIERRASINGNIRQSRAWALVKEIRRLTSENERLRQAVAQHEAHERYRTESAKAAFGIESHNGHGGAR